MNHTNTYPHFLQRFIKRALLALAASLSVLIVVGGSSVFAADAPTITGVVPASAYNTGGDALTVSGSGFLPGATVTVGGVAAQNVVIQSDTVITATTPVAFSVGDVKLRVSNTDGQYAEASFTYRKTAPVISSITPSVGPLYGGRAVSIAGSNFQKTLRFKDVIASDTFSIGITYDGKLYGWGGNNTGQLGNGTTVNSAIPTPVDMTGVLAGKTIVSVAAGDSHVVAVDSDGKVYAWGAGNGRLGNGTTAASLTPTPVDMTGVLAGKKVVTVAVGASTSLVLTSDGFLYGWGNNGNGQLGDGSTTTRNAPVAVNTSGVLAGKTIKAIAMGSTHAVAIDTDGKVYAWGGGSNGQIGNGTLTSTNSSPVAVTTTGVLSGKNIQMVAAGNAISYALDTEGKVYAWGAGALGQMGNGGTATTNSNPVAVTSNGVLSGKVISSISSQASGSYALAADSNGVVYSWGVNNQGQLGDNSLTNRTTPVLVNNTGVLSGKVIKKVSASGLFSLALDNNGVVYAWGYNNVGQLGDGTTTASRVPVATQLIIPLDLSVTFGGTSAQVTSITSNAVNVITPAHAVGAVDVSLSATAVDSATSTLAYTYASQPSIYSTSPNELYGTGGDIITITGENFRPGAQVKLGNGPYTTATYINSTTLQVASMATSQTGLIAVSVKNDDDQVGVSETSLRYLRATPVVNSITPRIGPTIGGQTVTLSGSGFSQNLVFTKIGMGASYSCGVADSKVYCWGYGGVGALGNGQTANSPTPSLVDMTGVLAGKSIISISAGVSHAVALDSDGKVYAWGVNTNGQLGDGSTTQRNAPVAVDTTGVLAGKRIVAISAGGSHTLALDSDGKVYAWGINQGRLGNGSAVQSTVPVAVSTTGVLAGKRIVAISAGNSHSTAIDSDGIAYGWGTNDYGQLGNNSTTTTNVPVTVTASGVLAGKRLIGISAGGEHTLALDIDGKVYAWGRNNSGQLGINSGAATSQVPVEVLAIGASALSGKKVIAVEAGMLNSSIALDSDGQVSAWGYNNNGQLGNNTTTQAIYPIAIGSYGALAGKTITKIAAGYYGTLAVGSDNSLYAWGAGTNGQLGNGSNLNSLIPVVSTTSIALPFTLTFDGIATANAIVPSDSSATVITPAHSAGFVPVALSSPFFASATNQGQYEYIPAPTATSITPNSASIAGGDTVTISGTGFRADTAVLFNDTIATATFINSTTLQATVPTGLGAGTVNVMVRNVDGQFARLGRAFTYTQATQPTLTNVTPASGPSTGGNTVTVNGAGMTASVRFTQVATGGTHSCGLTSRGTVYCWGYGTNGRLGNGDIANSSTPVAVDVSGVMAGKTIVAIAAGRDFSLALDADGKVYAWGLGSSGQLGNNSGAQSTVPVAVTTSGVLSGKTIKKIAAGAYHALVLDADGKMYAWGLGSSGQLGNNSTATSLVPVAVTSSGAINGKTITAISAGASHNTVLDSDGKVYSWGLNTTGQLGNGNTTQYGVPVAVVTTGALNGKVITAISAGGTHTLALDSNGKVYAWGRNNLGQLGEGSGATQSSPVAVDVTGALAGKTIAHVATGENTSFAIDSQGGTYSWGDNSSGQLGDGTQTQRNVPNIAATNIAFSSINGGPFATTTVGVAYDGSAYGWGANTYGQVGNNSTATASQPVLVSKASMSAESVVTSLLIDGSSAPITSALETSLTYVAPAHAAGKVSIVAQGPGFSDITLANAYEYIAPPSATSIAPASGYVTGGDTVTITGSNFSSGSTVTIGGSAATVTSQTATTITVTTPVHNAGSYDVVVTDTLGQSSTLTSAFTYRETPPVVTSITPSRGPVSGGQTVTIQGQSFSKAQFITGAGADHSCAITSGSGKAYCWGYNNQGQLGTGTLANSTVPVAVKTDGVLANKRLVAISLGATHTVALDSDGQLYAWGGGLYGQLGNAQSVNSSVPVRVDMTGVLAGKKILKIASANNYTLALADDGRVYSWGSNTSGELGDGTQTSKNYPVAVAPSSAMYGESIATISAGYYVASALTASGQAYVWGTGIAGNGTASALLTQPTAVSQSGKAFVDIAAGVGHVMATTGDGELYAWGSNDQGQIGTGNTTTQTLPVKVNGSLSGKKVTKIAATTLFSSSVALTADNELYTWGDGRYGQMGDGTTATSRTLPVKINGQGTLAGKVLKTISAGGTHIITQDTDSVLYAWGTGSYGKLGNGASPATQSTPVLVTSTSMLTGATGSIFSLNNAGLTASNQLNSTTIQAVTPPGQAGSANLTVTNTDGQTYTLQGAYEYVDGPTITSVSPANGSIAGGDTVYISGTNFTNNTAVKFANAAAAVTYVNPTTLLVTVPASATPGEVAVSVSDEFNQTNTLQNGYIYKLPSPTITSVSPQYKKMSGGSTVTITGSGFVNRTGGGSWYDVTVDGVAAQNVAYVNNTTLSFTAPAHAPGKVSIVVGGDYSEDALFANAFTYLPEEYEFTNEQRTLMATEPGEFTVQMLDAEGKPVVSTENTVLSLSSNSDTGFFARALGGSDGGWEYDSVIVPAGQSTATFYYRDSTSGTPTITVSDALNTSISQQVTINSRYKMLVTGISNPTQVGTPSSVTVQSVDYTGAPQADYRGTIHFTSDDGAATLPTDYTFTATDRGRKTFINGVTMGTTGTWDVTVTDTTDAVITGVQENILVNAPASGAIAQLKFITPAQSFPLDQTSGVISIQTQDVNGVPIPVSSSTSVYARTTSSTGQFSFDNGATWQSSPAQLTIPAGSSSRNVLYKDATAGSYELKVSQQAATDFGWQVDTQSVTVGVGSPSKLALNYTNGGAIGDWVPVDVTLTDESGNPVTSANDVAVQVGVSTGGEISLTADGTGASSEVSTSIVTGQQSVTVWVHTTSEQELTLTAADARDVDEQDKYDSTSGVIQFGEATPTSLVFSALPGQTSVRTPTAVQISVRDQFGNIVSAPEAVDVLVGSDSSDGSFALTAQGPWASEQTATIAAGMTGVQLYFKHETVKDSVTIQATSAGLESSEGQVNVTAGAYAGKVRFSADAKTEVTAGATEPFTIELLDAYGNPTVATETVEIGFGSTHTTAATWDGTPAVNSTAPNAGYTVSISAGEGSATASYRDTESGTATLKVYDQARWQRNCVEYMYENGPCAIWTSWSNTSMTTRQVVVNPQTPSIVVYTSEPQIITKDTASAPITVELQDQYGNAAHFEQPTALNLTTPSQYGSFALSQTGPFTATELPFNVGQSSATFYYQSSQPSSSQGDLMVVSGGSMVAGLQNIRVIEGVASQAALDTNGQTTAVAGDVIPIILRSQTNDGVEVVVLEDTTVTLSSDEGEFSLTETPFVPITTATLQSETSNRQLFYRSTVAGLTSLSARSSKLQPVETEMAITASTFYKLDYTKLPTDQLVQVTKSSESMVATAFDEFGNVALPSEAQVTDVALTSNRLAGEFALENGSWDATQTTIAAGASTTQPFYYRIGTIDSSTGGLTDSSVLGLQTITAEAQDALPAETELRVVGGLANRIVITSASQSLRAGEVSSAITIQLQDIDGTPSVASADQTVNLSSLALNDDSDFSAPHGNDVFSLTPGGDPITSLEIAAGQSTATFYVMPQTAESHRLRVSSAVYSHSGGFLRTVSATQNLSVVAGESSKLVFTTAEQSVYPNKVSGAIKVALTDAYGNPSVNEMERTLTLQSSCGTGEFLTSPTSDPVSEIVMASGQTDVTLYYRDSNASAGPCSITVSSNGLDGTSQNLVVREPVYALAITSDPQTVSAGQTSGPIIVETRDRFGNTVTLEDPLTVVFEAAGNATMTPTQRTIPAGSSSTQFTFRYDDAVSSSTPISITARDVAGGVMTAEQEVTVVPGAVSATTFSAPTFNETVGNYHELTVQVLNAYGKRTVATENLTFALSTSAPSGMFYQRVAGEYEPITTVQIGSGASESSKLYYRQTQTTRTQAGGNSPAALSATRSGITSAASQATIDAKILSFSTGNFNAPTSSYAPLRATIPSPLPEDLTVTLSTTDTSGRFYRSEDESSQTTTTVIPAGQTQSEQLYYRQTSQTPVGFPETLTATPGASSLSVWSGSVTATFYLSELSQIVFVNPTDTLEQNQTGTFTVEARDELGNVVPFTNSASGYCLYVGSTSGTATISGNQNAGCTDTAGKKAIHVAAYQTRATFSYKDVTTGEYTITAASNAGTGGIRVSTGVTITSAVTTKLAFDQTTYSLVRGDEITVALRMLNAYDFEANSLGNTDITLSSTSPSGKFFNSATNSWVSSLQVTIPGGQSALTGIRYSDSTAATSTTIQASTTSLSSAQATVTMGVGVVSGIVFKSAPATLEKAEAGTYHLGFVDEFGNEAPTTNSFCLYLQSSTDGVIADMPTGSLCSDVTLPGGKIAKAMYVSAGRTEIAFSYRSSVLGVATLSASTLPTGGGIAAARDVTIVNGEPTRVGIEPGTSTLERGGVMNGRAVLYNAHDAEVPATQDITVRLSDDFVDGEFATAGNGPWLESLDAVIPSGSSAVTFLYQTGADYLGDIVLTSTTTTQPSLESSTADVTVIMGAVAQLVFATPELTTTATHPSEMMTIEARNRFGVETVVDSDLSLFLRSSSNTGVFAATPTGPWGISNTKIVAGQSSVNVYYRDETVGTHMLTVRDKLSPQEGEEYLITTQQHHITAQEFSHFIVTNISSPTRAGVASSVVVFAVDSENYVVAGYNGTVTFSSDDPTAILPTQSYTFQPEIDRGIHTFNNAIAFKTTGTKSVTVTDQNGKQGSQMNIEVLLGNAAPVSSISFFNSDISVDKNRPTEALAMQLHDQSGALTNAPAGGMPLRLTSNSSTGEFSTDQTNWSSQLIITVEEGLSFSTTPVYYRDSTDGTRVITASDWVASSDNNSITNATLNVTVNDIDVAIDQKIYSIDYQGNTVQNPYIFSRNEQGDASGYTLLDGVARDIPTGNEVISNWNINISQVEAEVPGTARLSYRSPTLTRKAGDANLPVNVQVTRGSMVSSWQGAVPISPWRATLDQVAIDDTVFTGRLTVVRNGQADDSPQAIIQLTGGVNQVTRTWHLSELLAGGLAQQLDRGEVSFRVPLRLFAGGDYLVFVELSDGNGITAQDATQFSVTRPVDPEIPTVPGNTGGSGTISPETPGDTSSRPEPAQPTPPRDGAYEQSQPGLLTRILESPSTPIRVAQSMLGLLVVIALVLAYQMYREWRHARFLLAVIRRDNETLANKDAFLQLASHHLRTPLTLLSSSSELLNMNPAEAVKQINQQLAGVITGLKAKAEDILARTSTSEEIAVVATTPDEASARRNVYRSPVFWVPVILTAVLTIAANWAVQAFGGQTIAGSTVAGQVTLLLLGGMILYTVARLLVQRRQQSQALERSRAKTKALNDVKVNFARQVGRDLTDDILHVNAYIQQLAPLTDATSQNLLKEGVERLERLVSRFTLLNTVYANTTHQDVVDMQKTVDEALQLAQQQNPAVLVSVDGSIDPITTRHARWMVSRLLQDVVTSMVPLVGSGTIRVNSKQTKDATTLTITGPSNSDAPAEDLFSVYSRAEEELAGTFSTEDADNRMHRLDLYLDRMIADELQAELSARRVAGQMQVTVELPNA